MKHNYPLHIFLFLLTVFTTMMAGTELATAHTFFGGDGLGPTAILQGIPFSFAFLAFLTVHEFGDYLTAVYHKVRCSLPYYIPIFIPVVAMNIGSFGAVIRIKEVPSSRRKYFDIGVAGPLAGFVVALGMLLYGFMALPPVNETVLHIHPEYIARFGGVPSAAEMAGEQGVLTFGGSILFEAVKWAFKGDVDFPPAFEMMHYPFIFAGFLGLFFTALNLLPIGQLDGGHVLYGLLGARRAGMIARMTVVAVLLVGGMGILSLDTFVVPPGQALWEFVSWTLITRVLYIGFLFWVMQRLFALRGWGFQLAIAGGIVGLQAVVGMLAEGTESNPLWLFYAFMAVRFIGVDHPIALDDRPLNPRQKILGFLAILIFVLCFSPNPLSIL
jgi:membrane-associated protease RseP (regulator of RpoE activity)